MIKDMDKRKLLAIDLDGTLLNDDKLISEGNLKGLKKAIDKNTTIAIATGRALFSTLKIVEKYDFACYLICHNGALVMDKNWNREIALEKMDGEVAKKIINFCIEEEEPLHILGEDFWGVTSVNQSVERFMEAHNLELNLVKDIKEIENIGIINLVSVGNMAKVREFIIKNQIGVYFTDSVPNAMDIMGKSVSKGNGVKILADKLGFNKNEIFSIGNYYNDVEMFQTSNVGIAMENAPDGVKKHADYITNNCNNKDGVLEAIEKVIL